MNINEINKQPIRQYLAGKGIYPVKDNGYYGMYHSPFREDHNASMKVDFNKNLWIDYGTGEGGTFIDLIMRINNCSFKDAIEKISKDNTPLDSFSFHGNRIQEHREPTIKITQVVALSNSALLHYLKERQIEFELAKQYCSEVHYEINNKPYYAVGFQNDIGGWALRNEYFKGCILSMGVTSFINKENEPDRKDKSCLLFEGFTDFLSYLILKKNDSPKHDTIVLNSTSNLLKIQNILSEYKSIFTFLDNDEAGKRAVQNLRSVCKDIIDQSAHYTNHKDLNDYLCSRSVPKQATKKTPNRGRRM